MCRASFGPRVTSFSWEPTDPPSVTPPMPSDVKLSARRLRKKASVNLPMVINEPRHRCAGHKEFGVHHAATPEDSSEVSDCRDCATSGQPPQFLAVGDTTHTRFNRVTHREAHQQARVGLWMAGCVCSVQCHTPRAVRGTRRPALGMIR